MSDERAQQIRDLQDVLEYAVRDGEREAFEGMLEYLQRGGDGARLSKKQADWLRDVLGKHRPTYENLVSSGKVSGVSTVELNFVGGRPLKPPGR